MPIVITTNVNCGLGKSKSKGQPGNLAHNRREFVPYNTDPYLAVNTFSTRIAVWKRPIRQLSAIQLTSTILGRNAGIEFLIPGTIISNICSELIRIL